MELSDEEIYQNKVKIIELIKSLAPRDNVDKLLEFLEKSGYYYLYGSFKHHKYKGGLAEHSLEVMNYALSKAEESERDSIIIAALLHDLCKTKYNFPEGVEFHGHGSKSVAIIEEFIKFPLTEDEHNAIRFHMGSKCYLRTPEDEEAFKKAKSSELWELVHVGDCISAGKYPNPLHGTVKKVINVFDL